MKFNTAYTSAEQRGRNSSPAGSKYKKEYSRKLDITLGYEVLEEIGVTDIYDSIQKASIGISLEDLIRRRALGDSDAIRDPIDSFADISDMPSDILGIHSVMLDAKSKFEKLPKSIKEKFNNSYSAFIKSIDDGTVNEKINSIFLTKNQPVKPVNKEPVLSDEELKNIRNMIGGTKNA